MVTSVLHDSLKRSVNIFPSVCKFGGVKKGEMVEMIISVKNEDSLSQRIHIRPLADKRISISQDTYGAIAPGMIKKLVVAVQSDETGKIKEELQIGTKSDIFKIPIEVNILSEEDFEAQNKDMEDTKGRPLMNSRVRKRLSTQIAKGRKVMEEFREQIAEQEAQKQQQMDDQDIVDEKAGSGDELDMSNR